MAKMHYLFLFLLVLAGSLTSCAVSQDEMQALDRAVRSYERAFRWGEYATARAFHKSDPQLSDLERRRLSQYRITAFNTLRFSVNDPHHAEAMVEIRYYRNDRPVIKQITHRFRWQRDKDSDIWYITSAFPKIR